MERYGFDDEDITVLIGTDDSYAQPTGKNIRDALSLLIGSAGPGDLHFVHYSGRDARLPSETGEDDECIGPCDKNLITGRSDSDFPKPQAPRFAAAGDRSSSSEIPIKYHFSRKLSLYCVNVRMLIFFFSFHFSL